MTACHNHDHARYTAGSLSMSTSEALPEDSVSYPSVVPVLFFATDAPFIYYTQSDWGLRGGLVTNP